jgi:hypothetical protein
VESSCKCGNETSGSIKCCETIEWLHNCGLSSSAQLRKGTWPAGGRTSAYVIADDHSEIPS